MQRVSGRKLGRKKKRHGFAPMALERLARASQPPTPALPLPPLGVIRASRETTEMTNLSGRTCHDATPLDAHAGPTPSIATCCTAMKLSPLDGNRASRVTVDVEMMCCTPTDALSSEAHRPALPTDTTETAGQARRGSQTKVTSHIASARRSMGFGAAGGDRSDPSRRDGAARR